MTPGRSKENNALFLPVRRKLAVCSAALLLGVFSAESVRLPLLYTGIVCAFLLGWAVCLIIRRRKALFCVLAMMLLLGHLLAGIQLERSDAPTQPQSMITGVVSAVEREGRVLLSGVTVSGERLSRPAMVTLMTDEEGEAPAPVGVGQRVSGTGRLFAQEEARNPGAISGRVQALSRGYELSGYLLPGWTAEGAARFSLREAFRRTRLLLIGCIERLFGDSAPLFEGIMLGVREDIDEDVTRAMRLTGTVHILTVSGMHLGLIALALRRLLDRTPLHRHARFAVFSALLYGFAGLTGFAAGTVRALIMALMQEGARLRGRQYEPLTALSLAALMMTLINPVWPLTASFRFSFFVVLGIQLLAPGVSALLDHLALPRPVLRTLTFCFCAQLAALPMQLTYYGYVPLLALPMNMLISGALPVLLLGGWLALPLGAAYFPLGAAAASGLSLLARLLERAVLWAASLPGGILRLPAPPFAAAIILICGFMLLSRRIRFGRRRYAAAALCALLCAVCWLPAYDPQARYVQLDVGQGDAALFRLGRHAVLVDVGPGDCWDMLHYLRHEGLFVDAVILSHLDEDHAGLLPVLLDAEVDIPAIILPEGAMHDEVTESVRASLAALPPDTALHAVSAGDRISFGALTLDVLSPDGTCSGSNERSLLLHAQMEGVSFLLTGDLPADCEPETVPECDVLKVAHHGSRYATSDAFAKMASPETAIISVGENNPYGHPGRRVIDALAREGAQILRTDETGCITLWLRDGQVYCDCRL